LMNCILFASREHDNPPHSTRWGHATPSLQNGRPIQDMTREK
jgi:hypothetical protein